MNVQNMTLLKLIDALVDDDYSFQYHAPLLDDSFITIDYIPEHVSFEVKDGAYIVYLGKDSEGKRYNDLHAMLDDVRRFVNTSVWLDQQRIIEEDEY